MTNSNYCMLDMDGVIADFQGAIADAFGVPREWKAPGSWDVRAGLGIPWETWWAPCDQQFWENVPKTKDADDIVNLVLKYFDINNVCVITAFPTKHGYPLDRIGSCTQGKINWLNKHFPALTTHFLIGPSKHFCASPESWLVDDSTDHGRDFVSRGGKYVCVPRIWNEQHEKAKDAVGYIELQFQWLHLRPRK